MSTPETDHQIQKILEVLQYKAGAYDDLPRRIVANSILLAVENVSPDHFFDVLRKMVLGMEAALSDISHEWTEIVGG